MARRRKTATNGAVNGHDSLMPTEASLRAARLTEVKCDRCGEPIGLWKMKHGRREKITCRGCVGELVQEVRREVLNNLLAVS